jgi:hypothetical protein
MTFLGRLFGDSGRLYDETPTSESKPGYRPKHAARSSTPAKDTAIGRVIRNRTQRVRDDR